MSHGFWTGRTAEAAPSSSTHSVLPRARPCTARAPPAGCRRLSSAGCKQPELRPQGNHCTQRGQGSPRPARLAGRWQPLESDRAAVGVRVVWGVRGGVFESSVWFYPAGWPPPHVASREAGDTRSQSWRERRLCHCSTAVRCALSIRRQWLDSGAPVEYCPITIRPMKSLLLFTLCPYTAERERDREQKQRAGQGSTSSARPPAAPPQENKCHPNVPPSIFGM